MSDEQYPEHDKLHLIKDKSWAVGEFLEWLPTIGVHLARWFCPHEDKYFHDDPDVCDDPRLGYEHRHIESLLAEHFGISLATLEDEKQAMLRAQRALNERVDSHERTAQNTEGT